MKRSTISPASRAQRSKIKGVVCRNCGFPGADPAHVIDRSLGGCDDPQCVIPLCRRCHDAYDDHGFDVLPLLDWDEQAHAVSHIGLIGALERTTNLRWSPKDSA